MSIFKESFRKYIQQQLKLREAIVSLGNEGGGRMNNTKTVKLPKGGEVTLPPGAFYTNTINRGCAIRMSSGVDLKPNSSDLLEGGRYENPDDLIGPGLAMRYVLEGGTLINIPKKEKDGTLKPVHALRSGFPGSGNRGFGFQYGDPLIRANATSGEDNYGIVPMPGIESANIRTKSAYGSLREAKVNFKCHNQRQLEILELLYMRPGYPILLEWGWTTYIDNDGNNTSKFPHIYEFFHPNVSQEIINKKIIQNKIDTGGNYDGMMGICKNFNYKARPDGGYDCVTELTSTGEIIESLKASKVSFYDGDNVLKKADQMEHILDSIAKLIELQNNPLQTS
jgi:hypothetical protein